ncbi:MAG: hypothetical protein EAZ67_10975 [Cytophagales bacterium]|nr:MAG: hypothetical protein EAZ67_10975 [Cytophagales bacterium]
MSFTSFSAVSNINKPDFVQDISGLLNQDFSEKKILLYARENNKYGQLFRNYGDVIAKKYLKAKRYDIIADMQSTRDFVLETNKYSYADYTIEDWAIFRKILDVDLIIRNDRAFRCSIPYVEACEMIYSCTKFMIEFFKIHKYDVVITNMMDFYVTNIFVRVAEYFNIPVISFCENAFGLNYIMITKAGEPVYVREPTDLDVEELYNLIMRKSTPYVLNKKKVYFKAIVNYIKYKVKYCYHYLVLYKLLERQDYIYRLTGSGTYPRNILNFLKPQSHIFDDISEIEKLNIGKNIYIPLHYYPEATTDYWINHSEYTTYYPSLFEMAKKYALKGYNVIIKEHTAMFLYRDFKIYQELKAIENVYLMSPFITTFDVFKYVDYVLIWTGTTGIEAIIHDKKVIIAYNDPYYAYGKLAHIGHEHEAILFSEKEKKNMIKNILRSYLPII